MSLQYTKSADYLKIPQIKSLFLETIEPDQVVEITNKIKLKLFVQVMKAYFLNY